jgi:hypothetical protein
MFKIAFVFLVLMGFVLVTYVPFHRFHEVVVRQLLNARRLGVSYVTAYVDNVFAKEQVELLGLIVDRVNDRVTERTGNWRSRCGAWFSIIRDHLQLGKPFVVVDSDNEVVNPDKVLRFIDWVVHEHVPMAGVLDTTALVGGKDTPPQFMRRTVKVIEEYGMKIGFYEAYKPSLRENPFFIGPKQIVVLNLVGVRDRVVGLLDRVERAFTAVNPVLRNYISDETLLGLLAHLLGICCVPYLVGGTVHHVHSSTPGVTQRHYKHLVARAHYEFAKALCREGLCDRWYLARYLLSNLYNALGWLA